MAGIAGIWNHATGALSALGKANPMDSTQTGSGSSAGDASTISANDFLTLLVTEMKNQEPTADTNPNEYINQLVQVNSLEQLISINQNISTALGTSTTGSTTPGAVPAAGASKSPGTGAAVQPATSATAQTTRVASAARSAASSAAAAIQDSQVKTAAGNLSVPEAKPAAHRVAQALSGVRTAR